MPYKSKSQMRWAHTEKGKKALGGEGNVHEWDEATKGKKLPEKVSKAETLLKKPTTSIPNPSKVGSTAVKMPKASKQPDPFGKPSLFFKSENLSVKHPSLCKLKDFMQKKHKQK